jgi:hypothetical protein
MNQEDIICMAREAGIHHAFDSEGHWDGLTDTELIERFPHSKQTIEYADQRIVAILERFAALVAAAEREACAKVCDDLPVPPYVSDKDAHIWDLTCVDCANAIRARSQQ